MTQGSQESGGDLARLAEDFTAAEQALREIVQRARDLETAEKKVDQAREHADATVEKVRDWAEAQTAEAISAYDVTRQSLIDAEKSLSDGASALYTLASDLKDTARELKNNAVALRELEPSQLTRELVVVQQRVRVALVAATASALLGLVVLVLSLLN